MRTRNAPGLRPGLIAGALIVTLLAVGCSPTTPVPSPIGATSAATSSGTGAPVSTDTVAAPPAPTRTLASRPADASARDLAATIVGATDIDAAYQATAEALGRAGIRIESTTHVYVEPVAPAADSSMWPRQVLEVSLEATARRYVDRISANDAGAILTAMGWPVTGTTAAPGEPFLAYVRAWLQDARTDPGDPTSFAPLFAAEMIRLGDGVDLETAATADVHFGILELLVLTAGFERDEGTASTTISLALAQPTNLAVGHGRVAAEGPCDSTLERYGIPPNTGDVLDGQAPAWMRNGAVSLLGLSSKAAKLALKAVKSFQKLWRAAAFYFYSFVRVANTDGRIHKPNEEEPDEYSFFTASAGVDPDAFKGWVRDNGGPNGVRELNDDTRCAASLGMPTLTDVGDIADDADHWIVDWKVLEMPSQDAELAEVCATTPTSFCNHFDRFSTLGMKLRRISPSVAEARLSVKIKEEQKSVHTPGATERESRVVIRAEVDSSSMPSISVSNLTSPAGLIGPGLETIMGLVQSSFKPSSKATLIVTFHEAGGWKQQSGSPYGAIGGLKCDGLGGDWVIDGQGNINGAVTQLWTVTIDPNTLKGRYAFELIHDTRSPIPFTTIENARGTASVVVNDAGWVLMTLDEAPMTIKTTFGSAGSQTVKAKYHTSFSWEPAGSACTPPPG